MNPRIDRWRTRAVLALLYLLGVLGILASGGSDSDDDDEDLRRIELRDPTPGTLDRFGDSLLMLANGNIVVLDPGDSSVTLRNGAVHLFRPDAETAIASFYGDSTDDFESAETTFTALDNGNFVVAAPLDDVGGLVDAGSVFLVDGDTGAQIGSAISGDALNDRLGNASPGILALPGGNYVIASFLDDEGGIIDAGSVRLVDGASGVQTGATLAGDSAGDRLGSSGLTLLGNGNFVVASADDDEGGIADAGSVRLVDAVTGAQIGTAVIGDVAGDNIGSQGVTALANGNYVIASAVDDEGSVIDAGSARLVSGVSGAQLGGAITGDVSLDFAGLSVTALGNGNFVVASDTDDEGGIVDAGLVRLVDGATGLQIGGGLAGDVPGDRLSLGDFGITVLANDNFVVSSPVDDEGGIVDAGSARLISGTSGAQIGFTTAGDSFNDRLGFVVALSNGSYVVGSVFDDVGGVVDAGSVRLVNGAGGQRIGPVIAGDINGDALGSSGIVALANGNYAVASELDDVAGVFDAGSVRLVSGISGNQLGPVLAGDDPGDRLGSGGVTPLVNSNLVVVSQQDDIAGGANFGSVRLMDGISGLPIVPLLAGDAAGDFLGAGVDALANGDFVLLSPRDDEGGIVDAGSVRVIDGASGDGIGAVVTGTATGDFDESAVIGPASGGTYFLGLGLADNDGLTDSGRIEQIIP